MSNPEFIKRKLIAKIPSKIAALITLYNIQSGEYLYINDAVEKIIGYTSEDFLRGGVPFVFSLLHPEDIESLKKQNIHALLLANKKKDDEFITVEYRIRHKDGRFRWLHTSGIVFDRDATGKALHIMNVSVDITKRKEAEIDTEQLLQMRLAKEATITELGILALSGKELNFVLQKAAQKIQKVLRGDYVSILEYIPEAKDMIFRAAIGWRNEVVVDKTRILAGIGSHAGFTLKSKRPIVIEDIKKEKRFHISSPLKNHQSTSGVSCVIYGKTNPFGVLSVHTKKYKEFSKDDINFLQSIANIIALTIERKNLEKQKNEFIGMVSHELKTPVTSIKAFTQLLLQQFTKVKDEKSALLLSKMDGQINKLTILITDLLDVTKNETGKLKYEESYFDFTEMVQEVVEETQRITQSHKIISVFDRSKTVYGDRERLGQVITNLLTNGIKYSPNATEIIVKTTVDDNKISLSVQDFGIGIAKDKQSHVFEQFFRVNDPYEKSFPGLGLGLYISAEIIRRHKGKMWVTSEKGKGSLFGFSLPLTVSQKMHI